MSTRFLSRTQPRTRLAGVCALVLLAAALPGFSARAEPARDLLSVWQAAQTQDATLRSAQAAAAAGRERVPQAKAALRPNVALAASRFKTERISDVAVTGGGTVEQTEQYGSGQQSLTLRQALYRPQQWAQLAQAEAQQAQSEARLAREQQLLATRVAEAYFDLLLAGDQLRLIDTQARNARTQLNAAEKAFAGGSGIRTDIAEAQAKLDLIEAQSLEAQQQQDAARQQLGTLLAEPVTEVALLDEARFQPEVVAPLGDWLARVEAGSPELLALQAQRDAAAQAVTVANAAHRPTLDVVAQWVNSDRQQYNRADDRYSTTQIGLQLNLPLYAGGATSSAVRQALAEQEQASEGLEAARRELGTRVAREWRGVTEGAARVRALQQAVRSTAQAVEANQKSFQAGARTTLDVLQAQELAANAQRDLARARYLHLVSLVKLHALAGQADAGLMGRVNAVLQGPAAPASLPPPPSPPPPPVTSSNTTTPPAPGVNTVMSGSD